jgi:hypothetical protein
LKCALKKLYNFSVAKRYAGGRENQMQAARTYRRVAEIEWLFEERHRKMKEEVSSSPWADGSLEPPAVSMGNAVAWRASSPGLGEREPATLDLGSHHRDESSIPAVARKTPAPSRRPPVCSCCSQIRSLGHARTCSRSNKTCSRCRHEATLSSDPT